MTHVSPAFNKPPHGTPLSHIPPRTSLRARAVIRLERPIQWVGMVLAFIKDMSMDFSIYRKGTYATSMPNMPHQKETSSASPFDRMLQKVLSNVAQQQPNGDLVQLSQQYIQLLTSTILTQLDRASFSRLTVNDVIGSTPSHTMMSMPMLPAHEPMQPNEAPRETQPLAEKKTDTPFSDLIQKAAKTYEIDADLIRAVIKVESNYDAKAVSHAGARGLMQLMPETAKDMQIDDAFDPEKNIMAGSRYLKQLLHRYDNKLEPTLAAYNWGMGNLERHPDRLPDETRNYIAKVTGILKSSAT